MPVSTLPRLLCLAEFFKRQRKGDLKSIIEYLRSADHPVSQRTIERDLARLRETYGIEIDYDHTDRVYRLQNEQDQNLEGLCQLSGYFNTTDILQNILRHGVKGVDVIDMESQGELLGVDWLEPIFQAITNKRNIRLHYQSFESEVVTEHDVSPFLLKYYQGRWYVIGLIGKNRRTFGVDRIHDIEQSATKYTRYSGDPKSIFREQIGIYYDDNGPVTVKFLATPKHAKYLSTLKMHPSQQHLGKKGKWEVFSLHVRINFELVQHFLMAGERVIVLEPPHLISLLKGEIKKMYGYYFKSDR